MRIAQTILILVSVSAAAIVGQIAARHCKGRPYLALATVGILAACFAAQLRWPHLLVAGERNAIAVREGQFYRLLTAQLLQDGGVLGATFNLASLAVLATIAEGTFPAAVWIAIYVFGGLLTEGIALFWQPIGAGNSICYMSLAGALLIAPLRKRLSVRLQLLSALGLSAGLILFVLHDIHGAAVLIGGCLGLVSCHSHWQTKMTDPRNGSKADTSSGGS